MVGAACPGRWSDEHEALAVPGALRGPDNQGDAVLTPGVLHRLGEGAARFHVFSPREDVSGEVLEGGTMTAKGGLRMFIEGDKERLGKEQVRATGSRADAASPSVSYLKVRIVGVSWKVER